MKVAIEARAITNKSGGVKRYVENLIKGVNEAPADIDLTVILDKDTNLPNITSSVIKRYGQIGLNNWLNNQIPKELTKKKIDLVHYTKADVPNKKTLPTVVTIYDVIPLLYPKSQKFLNRMYWSKALRRAATKSDAIITISETSKQDIVNQLNVSAGKIAVTRLAIAKDKFQFTEEKEKNNPYILYVGTIEPRKNIAALIKSFNLIKDKFPHKLVIVGRKYKGYEALRELAQTEGISKRIEWKDYVDDNELVQLYSKANLFVWPSIYEGWGFPPQEAMASGTPVIVSNGGALPEVVGEAGSVVKFSSDNIKKRDNDPEFVTRLAQEMETVLSNKELQQSMTTKGKIQAAKYTWEDAAKTTIDVYKKLI
jgi:glycosyltransferase involved in cell wall biosynthesis